MGSFVILKSVMDCTVIESVLNTKELDHFGLYRALLEPVFYNDRPTNRTTL